MRVKFAALSAVAVILFSTGAFVQAAQTIALKSGETAEITSLSWVVLSNCRSVVKGPMTVEVLDGPPEVTASIREQKVIAHGQNCEKKVDGGILLLTSPKEIKERTEAKTILRVKFPTADGVFQKSFDIDLILIPSEPPA